MPDAQPHRKPAVAFAFRYGPGEHSQLFHALPALITALSNHVEVHYYGLRSRSDIPEPIRRNARLHLLPWHVNRTRGSDKWFKTLLWLLALPWIAMDARRRRISVLYIDETIPLSAAIARLFFGRNVAFTVADIFVNVYLQRCLPSRVLARALLSIDKWSWRRLPLIFTRARSTRDYLAGIGVDPTRVHPVYDPCDFSIFHPGERETAREKYGYERHEIVLVHHGILHPNKGNDRILRALAGLVPEYPQLRFLLVGDGPEMRRLRGMVHELDLRQYCRFTGWLPTREELNTALNAADIGLVMRTGARSDDFHVTGALVHNMACGLPVVAARLGGVSEVIHEDINGLLFDPDDPDEFEEKIAMMVTDEERRMQLGAAALQDARRLFSIGHVVDVTVSPLLKLANES